MPVFYDALTSDDRQFFDEMAHEMISCANQFTVTKKNIGVQENIKYPKTYREKINRRLLNILDCHLSEKTFDIVHSNTALEVNV